MTRRLITAAEEWRGSDGWSQLVITRDLDGRTHISVHDTECPGFTASFDRTTSDEIAAFIRGDA